MSDIPAHRRKATTLDAQSLAYKIRSEITTELMLTFGYSEKRLEQHIRKVTEYIPNDEVREMTAGRLRECEETFDIWFIAQEREAIMKLARGIAAHLRAGNTIWPSNLKELEERRLQLDKALECCNTNVTCEEIENWFRSWLCGNYKYMSHEQIYKMNSLYVALFGRRVTWKKRHGRLRWLMAHPLAA